MDPFVFSGKLLYIYIREYNNIYCIHIDNLACQTGVTLFTTSQKDYLFYDKQEINEDLDDLILSFNNKSIKVNNWISLRSFVNKLLSSYPG